jgi:hypothetical protein
MCIKKLSKKKLYFLGCYFYILAIHVGNAIIQKKKKKKGFKNIYIYIYKIQKIEHPMHDFFFLNTSFPQ